jgi:aminopeptidase N
MHCRRIFLAAIILIAVFVARTSHAVAPHTPEYDLNVFFDIAHSKITGSSQMGVAGGERLRFRVTGLTIRSVEVNRKPASFELRDGILTTTPVENGNLEIRYDGVFKPAVSISGSRDTDISSVIGREGIFLISTWYPKIDAPAIYRLRATLPRGYVAISEAESIHKVQSREGVTFSFQFNHPVDGINFVASDRYQILQERFHGMDVSAYFFPEDRRLAQRYVAYAKKYIQLYETLLLPFPFKRFAIVENFLPTGYSMPTYTLLGQEVMRLPFIIETSLGHEVLHQWFGNQVYGSDEGNWTEGLTTYLADHLYQEKKGEGWRYRKQILIDYGSYVHETNDFPLKNFTRRFDAASRSIGYGKAAMVFHMLRLTVGDEIFFAALKRLIREKQFQRASWSDLQNVFERQSGQELSWFFQQWLYRRGLPSLQIGGFAVEQNGGAFALNFDLGQQGEIYRLDVPLRVLSASGGEKNVRIPLAEKKKRVRIELEKEPAEVVIDGNYDLARKLTEPEVPPVVANLIGANQPLVVLPLRHENFYNDIIKSFQAKGAVVKSALSVSDAEIRGATLVLLGSDQPLVHRLYGNVETAGHGFTMMIKKNPWDPAKSVGILSAASAGEAQSAFPKIFHYGKYSKVAFDKGHNVAATIAPSERGMRRRVKEDPPVVDLSTLETLTGMSHQLAPKKIVYVGEEHDKFSHHRVQLEILRALYRQNPKVAVGMEMFQRPFQNALDDYIAGTIDERTFLKRSEYFKRWGIDYHLYKAILDFAKEKHLPVIALNQRREIVDKVAKGGLDSLSKEEQEEVPRELDFSDQEYRARLKEVFAEHRESQEKNFVFFYQAQILWDEAMAESIDRFLKKNPDFRVVVLAGAGHLQYGSGIPKRAFRRNGFDYSIVLNDAEVEKGIADFIVFPKASKGPTAPRLGVVLDERNQKVRITEFARDSIAEKAGLKVEDTLIALDDDPVSSIEDVRIALLYKHAGETLKIKARRGDQELGFNVRLQ